MSIFRVTRVTRVNRVQALRSTFLLSTLAAACAHAEPAAPLDRFSIAAGAFYTEPKISAEGDSRYGHLATPEGNLGHATLPRVKAELLLGDSHGLSFDYFRYDKSYNPTFSGQTSYEGRAISGTGTVNGKLKIELAQLAYRWWLGHGQDVFGIGVGAAYLHARVSGTGTATAVRVDDQSFPVSVSGTGSAGESVVAPLLELGWRHAFSPEVRMFAEASGIKKNGGRVDGHIYGATAGVEWFPVKQVGLVFDYGIQKIKLNRDQGNDRLNVRLTGPSVFVKVRF
jgi:hypothetical protein